jgi:hypothetical protein
MTGCLGNVSPHVVIETILVNILVNTPSTRATGPLQAESLKAVKAEVF